MWQQLSEFLVESRCELCLQHGRAICHACIKVEAGLKPESSDPKFPIVVYGHNPDVVRLVISWKDRQRRELTEVFADSVVAAISKLDLSGFRFIPIPSRRKSFRKRGWNPTADLARRVAQKTDLSHSLDELHYLSEPSEQRGLDHIERTNNQSGRFEFKGADSKVILIDDVFTSGATLRSAVSAVRESAIGDVQTDAANSPKIVAIVAARADFIRFFQKFS